MKVAINELRANPFHDGELDKEQVNRLVNSMKGVGFLGSLEVQQNPKTKKYHIVFGHHRKEAAEQTFGKNYKIEVIVQPWDEDKLMRGKANENLTQTHDPTRMIREVVDIRNYLKKRPESGRISKAKTKPFEAGSLTEIDEWLNANGEIISRSKIGELLAINDNLDPSLKKKIIKGASNDEDDDSKINYSNAVLLAGLDDHKEQKAILKAFEKSNHPRIHRVRTRQKIITQYKELKKKAEKDNDKKAMKEVEAIKQGKKDIALVGIGVSGGAEESLTPITVEERFVKVQETMYQLQSEIEDLDQYIDNASDRTLEKMGVFIKSFVEKKLAPFTKKIIVKLGKMKGGIYWTDEGK